MEFGSDFLRISIIAVLLKAMCPRYGGNPFEELHHESAERAPADGESV